MARRCRSISRGRFIYYVGPVDAVRDEAVGPAGPTTATRMDKFTRQMLAETGLLGMVGKAERGPVAIDAIREFQAVYLIAIGGAAYLVSKAIKSAKVLAFEDLGMEAIYEFEVEDMPVTVAVTSDGVSVHQTGPAEWAGADCCGTHRIARRSARPTTLSQAASEPNSLGSFTAASCPGITLRRIRRAIHPSHRCSIGTQTANPANKITVMMIASTSSDMSFSSTLPVVT